MMTLFYMPGACSLASHIALEEAGASYDLAKIDLAKGEQKRPEFLKLNPKGRVPALATDRGVLTESPVILAYIAQSYPDAALGPIGDTFGFADMQAFNLFLATTVHVAFAHYFRPERYADGEDAAKALKAKVPATLAEAFGLVEAKLADGRPFVHGERYTVSDPYLLVFARWFEGRGVGRLSDFPNLKAHHDRVSARPAVRAALAAEGLS